MSKSGRFFVMKGDGIDWACCRFDVGLFEGVLMVHTPSKMLNVKTLAVFW